MPLAVLCHLLCSALQCCATCCDHVVQAKADAAAKAAAANKIADEAASRQQHAERDAAHAQAQRQQREITIQSLESRCREAEATLAKQDLSWKEERTKLKESYKIEVDKVSMDCWISTAPKSSIRVRVRVTELCSAGA